MSIESISAAQELTAPEWLSRLHPELQAGAELQEANDSVAIYHLHLHDPHSHFRRSQTPEEVNAMFERSKARAEQHRQNREWRKYIVTHAKPYWCETLWEVRNELSDREYWTLVGQVWINSDNNWQYLQHWALMFIFPRPEREYIMPEEDRKVFDSLPEQLTIYRGCNRLNKHGLSWTLNPEVAETFATKRNIFNLQTGKLAKGRVIERVIHKSEAIAYLNDRKEEEIVTMKFLKKGSL